MHFVSFGNSTRRRVIGLIALSAISSLGFGQLRVATWNVTNFGGSETTARKTAFQTAIFSAFSGRSMNPDILIAQEINGSSGATAFLSMLNSAPGQSGQWAMNPFSDVGDSDTVFYYRTNKVDYTGLANIAGDPRDTQRYDFKLKGYDAGSAANPLVSLYSSHLKAGTAPTGADAERRQFETRNIRTDSAAQSAAGRHVLIGGDFNVSTSSDLGMRQLTDASITNNASQTVTGGRFFDPINSSYTSGGAAIKWQDSAAYRHLHTQDPYGSGGMDDRMDFILFGQTLRDGKGLEYVGSATAAYGPTWNDSNHSYRVWGNDGQQSVGGTMTLTNNQMVGTTIANAIKDSIGNSGPTVTGGHLPIFLDVKVPADLKVAEASEPLSWVTFQRKASTSATPSTLHSSGQMESRVRLSPFRSPAPDSPSQVEERWSLAAPSRRSSTWTPVPQVSETRSSRSPIPLPDRCERSTSAAPSPSPSQQPWPLSDSDSLDC